LSKVIHFYFSILWLIFAPLKIPEEVYKIYADHRFKRLRKHRQGFKEVQKEIRKIQDTSSAQGTPELYQAFCKAPRTGAKSSL
jgi:hypothetical protein